MILKEILKRKSVRSYLDKDVGKAALNEVLEAGRLAPSACNIQPWKFIVIRDTEKREKIAEACKGQNFISAAPVIIVACLVSKGFEMGDWYDSGILDVGIALDHMTLQAVHLGLGTCWIGAFEEQTVKQILGIPETVRVVALLTLGYPRNDSFSQKDRKNLYEILSNEHF